MTNEDREPADQAVVDTLIADRLDTMGAIASHILVGTKIGLADLAIDIRLFDALNVVLAYYGVPNATLPNFLERAS